MSTTDVRQRDAQETTHTTISLVTSDVAAARDELVALGVDVSEVFQPATPGAQVQADATTGRTSWYAAYVVAEQAGTELPT